MLSVLGKEGFVFVLVDIVNCVFNIVSLICDIFYYKLTTYDI